MSIIYHLMLCTYTILQTGALSCQLTPYGSGFRGLGLRVWGLGFGVWGLGLRADPFESFAQIVELCATFFLLLSGLGFWGLGFKVEG